MFLKKLWRRLTGYGRLHFVVDRQKHLWTAKREDFAGRNVVYDVKIILDKDKNVGEYDFFRTPCVAETIFNHEGKKVADGQISFNNDLVTAMVRSGDFDVQNAILISTTACTRCKNALGFAFKLSWGYAAFSKEWHTANTSCCFCCPEKEN